MRASAVGPSVQAPNSVAGANRALLHDAGVLTVGIIGGPGCGKTTLITSTIERLAPAMRVGVIACDIASGRDAQRISNVSSQVVQVNTHDACCTVDAGRIRDALKYLDLKSLNLLIIEHIGNLTRPPPDVGQDILVTMFSVAGGDDKADRHPDLVRAADTVVLNKLDLLPAVPFNLMTFRRDVARIKPGCDVMEISAVKHDGLDRWVHWLRFRTECQTSTARNWFG
jgi:hydrogenase nickel incorporation protein HypB